MCEPDEKINVPVMVRLLTQVFQNLRETLATARIAGEWYSEKAINRNLRSKSKTQPPRTQLKSITSLDWK